MKHTDLKHFIISIACIFVSSIIFIGLFFHDNKYTHAGLQPANGILYLSESELSSHSLRFLIRGWCFYPDRLLTPDDLPDNSDYMTYTAIGEHTHFDLDGRRSNPHGQGTYVLRIILPEKEASYSLMLPEIYSSYRLYVNDSPAIQVGNPSADSYSAKTQERTCTFTAGGTVTIVIAVSDQTHFYSGMIYPPAFGYILITVVAVFLIVAVVWSIKTPKVYTIQAQGTVTNDESNYVMCSYTGEILDSNMEEGALVEAGDVLFTIKSTDYDLQQTQLEDNRKSYEEQISQYSLLIKSIKDDTNYFDETKADDGLYWSLFETYKSQVEQNKVDVSTYQAYGYTDEQIQAQLETNQGKIDEVYYSAIQSAEAKIAEADQQIESIDAQLAAVSGGQDSYEVKATASGVLHMLGNYKSGMVVQTTTTVATITPENSQRYLEAYVSTSDMARMHEGDRVQVVMDGLSQNVYGTISGSVSRIDSNVTTQEGQDGATSRAFKVMIVLDQDYVLSREGDKVDVTNGMTAAARIQYDKVTYFNYVLEKLGIKTGK